MARHRRAPETDDQQLYGHETRLIDTHGPDNPGPDPSKVPAPADDQLARSEPDRSEARPDSSTPPPRRSRARRR